MSTSELHSHTGVNSRLGAEIRAHGSAVQAADARSSTVVEAELVLPVAPGNPDGHELSVLRSPDRLAGVEGQTDRLAVEFGLGGSATAGQSERLVLVALRSIETSATADGEFTGIGARSAAPARPIGVRVAIDSAAAAMT